MSKRGEDRTSHGNGQPCLMMTDRNMELKNMLVKTPGKKIPNPMDKHVGGRVRMRRMMLTKSQGWLGDQLGLTFQQVQKYEKGTNRIGAGRLQQIANALQVTPDFFFDGMPGARGTSQGDVRTAFINEELATRDGLALITAFHELKPKHRAMVVDLAKNLAGEK